jgi:hypothetical protein
MYAILAFGDGCGRELRHGKDGTATMGGSGTDTRRAAISCRWIQRFAMAIDDLFKVAPKGGV